MGAGSIGQASRTCWRPAHDDDRAAQLFTVCAASSRRDEPLARHTSWRCGGRADIALPARRSRRSRGVSCASFPRGEPLTVIGLGSNLLVRDGGVRGTVVLMHAPGGVLAIADGLRLRRGRRRQPEARALRRDARLRRSGVPCRHSRHRRRRAGDERRLLRRRDMAYVARVEVLHARRRVRRADASDYAIGYRSVRRADGNAPDGVFTAAWFGFPHGDSTQARDRIRSSLRDASRRSRSICRTPARCSAIRKAITPRG